MSNASNADKARSDAALLNLDSKRRSHRRRHRHGIIYVVVLGVIIVLTGMALVFARSMRTEAVASANRLSFAQADAIEQGAEQWVIAQTSTYQNDAVSITGTSAEAIQIGNGYFWLLHPNPVSDQVYMAGIVDESSKLNINSATSAQLQLLPGMTPTGADSIVDWAKAAGSPSPNGAQSEFYEQLAEPYQAKNAPFETVEELLLVNGWSPELLFGYDANRDGVVDQDEQTAAGTNGALDNANGNSRGLFNWLTCYTVEPNTASDGSARINVNSASTSGLAKLLTKKLTAAKSAQIIARITPRLRAARPPALAFPTLATFYTVSQMSATDFGTVYDNLTASTAKTLKGLINVNTAPLEVLEAIPATGWTESDAQTLIASQSTSSSQPGVSWLFTALSPAKAISILPYVTVRSYQYSADIVAVSGDGRAFKRVRIVLDTTTLPPKIVYRRDLTSYGWPLPQQIQDSMRSGKGVVTGLFATPGNSQISGLNQ